MTSRAVGVLRSTVTPEGDRHGRSPHRPARHLRVAIHGHPGGRPPPPASDTQTDHTALRSTVTPEGDRHRHVGRGARRAAGGCDPRSPRRATATGHPWVGTPGMTGLRSTVTPEGDRHQEAEGGVQQRPGVAIHGHPGGRPPLPGSASTSTGWSSCDPRSPRRATATPVDQREHCTSSLQGDAGTGQDGWNRVFCFGATCVARVYLGFRSWGGRSQDEIFAVRLHLGDA